MAILFALAAPLALSVVVRAYAAARPSAKRRIDSSSSAIYTTARWAGIEHDLLELTSARNGAPTRPAAEGHQQDLLGRARPGSKRH